jgi:glycosyltransferase involved in cell wall biosynthesis
MYGAEAVILNLCRSLPKLGISSSIAVFLNSHNPDEQLADVAEQQGVRVFRIKCGGRFDRAAIRCLRSIIAETGCDVIHAHGYKADLYAYAAARSTSAALVATCHTWYDNDFTVNLYGKLDRWLLRRFDRVVGVSDTVLKRLRVARVAEHKMSLINNGIEVATYDTAEPTFRTELSGQRLVGAVARLAPEKGIKYLVQAAAMIARSWPNVTFVVAGEGPERGALEQLIHDRGLTGRFVLLGYRRDSAGLFRSFDVLVQPSLDEGLPITLLEAMAAGCAIVATPVGAVSTAIEHETSGLMVPPGDAAALAAAIERTLDDEVLRNKLRRNAQVTVRQAFSTDRMAQEYVRVYAAAVLDKKSGCWRNFK